MQQVPKKKSLQIVLHKESQKADQLCENGSQGTKSQSGRPEETKKKVHISFCLTGHIV